MAGLFCGEVGAGVLSLPEGLGGAVPARDAETQLKGFATGSGEARRCAGACDVHGLEGGHADSRCG